MIIQAPNHHINPSAPEIEGAAVLANTNDQHVQTAPRIIAFIRPTGANHRVFYSVEVTTKDESGALSLESRRVKPDDILKRVSLNELTRFEHRQFLDEQAWEKARLTRRRQRRAGRRPSTIRPLGSVEETEASANDDPRVGPRTLSTPYPGQKRPRGRPRKQLFSVQIHPAYDEDVGSSSAAANSLKRRRESSISSNGSDQMTSSQRNGINNLASAGKNSRRRDMNFQHVSLPQVKKRVRKSEHHRFSISSESDVDRPSVPTPTIFRETLAFPSRVSQKSASEDSMLEKNPSTASGHLNGISQRIPDAIGSTQLSFDSEASDELALADVSSEEDELQQPTTSSPQTTIRISIPPASVISSSSGQDDTVNPPPVREASLDLGASSSSEGSMVRSPVRLQSRSSLHQDDTAANSRIDESSDSMISSPVRLQKRTTESHRATGEIEIVELSSDEALAKNQSFAEDESEAESEAAIDDYATEPEDAYADLVIPSIPSSQSFRNHASSVSSDEFSNVVLQKSEAQATTRRAHLKDSEPKSSRYVLNGTSRSNGRKRNLTTRPSSQTPRQRASNIPIKSKSQDSEDSLRPKRGQREEHAAANQFHATTSPQQQHRLHRDAIKSKQPERKGHSVRPPNPIQQFSHHSLHPTQADSLASMGAGQTFISTPTKKPGRVSTSASLIDSSTQSNPYGRPLPLHPVTPPGTLGHKSVSHMKIDTNGVKSRPTTQKRSRQSMTPLFPRRAIIPDLLGSNGSPTKRKEKILSTQQFQA